MATITYRPTTPSLRGLVSIDRTTLWKGKPHGPLTRGTSSSGGRNNNGRITSYHRGGGHKRRYRLIDFKRQIVDQDAVVERIEYDPNRSAFIALIRYADEQRAYILAPHDLKVGAKVRAGNEDVPIAPGCCMPLSKIPLGTAIHNIEMKPGKGGQLVRSAGNSAQVTGRDAGYVMVRLPSGEVRLILGRCMATIGSLSNPDRKNIKIGKAGRKRWLGRRPVVRGVAMNPVDHPHGGGEGKTSGGRHPVTPWGKPTKGKRTRRNKASSKFILRRRKGS
ncbi:MAG: 50S ribosomal protein L2 [Alphaproteobacteria bacterium GM202ARS2]|nr:50S ribosomal protein L2 [Alphaproteobacteria bacterium GM202ARS2]